MHLAYGAANCSGPAAQRLYAERYSTIRIRSHNFLCAAAGEGNSKYEYVNSSARNQGFLSQCLEDFPRTGHASISRGARPGTAKA